MHPEWAMGRHSIEHHLCFGKSIFDFFGGLESFIRLQHVIRWLSAGCAGFFGVFEKLRKAFAPVLGAFNAGVKTDFSHNFN